MPKLIPLLALAICFSGVLAGARAGFCPTLHAGDEASREGAPDSPKKATPSNPKTRPAAPSAAPAKFQGGVCWVGPTHAPSLRYLREMGVRWVSVTPFGYGHTDESAPPEGGYRFSRFPGESVEGVRQIVRDAHAASLAVMLKPHLWFSTKNSWRGKIAMKTPEDWQRWFTMYREFLAPFVKMAREEKVAIFCLGTELAGTVSHEEWPKIIKELRSEYSGQLTYAANWYDEFDRVPFWKQLDFIGVQAYFPLTDKADPSVDEVAAGWKKWKPSLEKTARESGRPLLFTEFGYKPVLSTTVRPWEWRSDAEPSPGAQLRAYEGAFKALHQEPWFNGVYVWKWYSNYTGGEKSRRRHHDNFSPQGYPAERAIEQWFRKLQGISKNKGKPVKF